MNQKEKIEAYELLVKQVDALACGDCPAVGLLANVSAAIQDTMGFFWTGFYFVANDRLELGPFQGPVACYILRKGRGVCAAAWERKDTVIVPDVENFPGHVACSSLSRSEIVVPVFGCGGEVIAVLDIDSRETDTFDQTDAGYLKKIAAIVSPHIESLLQSLPVHGED